MSIRLATGNWTQLATDARAIRHEVFVLEQQVPVELEWDDMDEYSLHIVAYDESGMAIGTARLLPDGHIGRMAVRRSARMTGVGGSMLRALMQQAQQRGDVAVLLNAQLQALAFYARHGFVQEGEEFLDAGMPHIAMRHSFKSSGI
jgi:predicted GNAT family N-acyltransferase